MTRCSTTSLASVLVGVLSLGGAGCAGAETAPPPAQEKVERAGPCPESCPPGETCVRATGRCAPVATLRGRILGAWSKGAEISLILDRGHEHGVRVGTTGTLQHSARAFTVVAVYPYRCRAVTPGPLSALAGEREVTFLPPDSR